MKNVALTLTLLATVFLLAGCSKKKVRKSQLDGKVYNVEDVAVYMGMDYATWKNVHEGEVGEGGLNITAASGTWDFTDIEDINVNMTYSNTWDDGGIPTVTENVYTAQGTLDMLSNSALSFGIENDWDYQWIQVHESKGKNLTLVFSEQTDLGVPDNTWVAFVVLKR